MSIILLFICFRVSLSFRKMTTDLELRVQQGTRHHALRNWLLNRRPNKIRNKKHQIRDVSACLVFRH